ncbi:MAG: hypothetical protein K2X09_06610 [Rickettsiales bacterium]|nr:hypothetical protein [Rickettsiales bacterium]
MIGKMLALALVSLVMSGCDKLVDGSRAAESITRNAFDDSVSTWSDLFTYHPRQPDSLPQTRYCYQLQSDIVCYDNQQTTLTAKLVGYQDGENLSWVQPGGGSLGASGGEPIALRPVVVRPVHAPTVDAVISNSQQFSRSVKQATNDIYTGPVSTGSFSSSSHIGVKDLTPNTAKR